MIPLESIVILIGVVGIFFVIIKSTLGGLK